MNIHNKTQITHLKINCILKDSSCDTPLPKILMLAIFDTSANQELDATLTLKKRNTTDVFTHRLANRSSVWLTQDQQGLSTVCNGDECKEKTHFPFGEDKLLSSSLPQNPLQT
ncbi:hypothetical protein H5410_004898 [Solanum commersonii]|uniref:Uncharacterized protein n=1 Tax=Solanum commersonii TaxID=4109 RepID=A0A9J6A5N3_SOLCO|nr:hypothetical protein H5410_004898 [Solanum commersonii]